MSSQSPRRKRARFAVVLGLTFSLLFELASPSEAAVKANWPSLPVASIAAPFGAAFRAAGSWFGSLFHDDAPSVAPAVSPSLSPGEVVERRTATTRTTRNDDGSYTLEAFPEPIHYKDIDGDWRQIDNTLVTSDRSGYAWENKANDFKVYLKDEAAGGVAVETGGDTYTITPRELGRVGGSRDGSEATYVGAAPDTDIAYQATATGMKETLILRGPDAPSSFSFLLDGPAGTEVKTEEDGTVVVKDGAGKRVFSFDAPWAQELQAARTASPILPTERHALLTAAKIDGGHQLTLAIDKEWLAAKDRKFPVIVDPTVTFQPSQSTAREAFVMSSIPDYSVTPGDRLYVGTDEDDKIRSLVSFDTTSIPYRSIVSSSTLSLYWDACLAVGGQYVCDNYAHTINAHRITGGPWNAWGPTWNWANANYSTTVLDSVTRPITETAAWHNWTVTSTVQKWVNAEWPNYGFLLKLSSETLSRGGPAYYSSRTGTSSRRPKLAVTYTANATHGYPPAAPPAAGSIELYDTPADSQNPLLPETPTRALLQASDGTLASFDELECDRKLRSSAAPWSMWSAPQNAEYGCGAGDAFIRTDTDTIYEVSDDDLTSLGRFVRWTKSGSTWTRAFSTNFDTGSLVGARSIVRTSDGTLWIAFNKAGASGTGIYLTKSTDDGANWSSVLNQIFLGVNGTQVQLIPIGSQAGIIVSQGGQLKWLHQSNWSTITTFSDTLGSDIRFQAVVDDQNRVHLVYSGSSVGIRYRMRDAAGTWSPAPSSAGTSITTTPGALSLSTDGTNLLLMHKDGSNNFVRRTWNGSWSGATTTITPPYSWYTLARVALPQRLRSISTIPYTYEKYQACDTSTPPDCDRQLMFDYVDTAAPGGTITAPTTDKMLIGTESITTSPTDDAGVQRVDFYVDRGAGIYGYLGTDSSAPFSYSWNTRELDGSSKRLWADGAYRLYAVAWDYKGNKAETSKPLVFIQDQDLGIRAYRPNLPMSLGAGLEANVNLWNGNLTVSQTLLSDPTVIGPLSIERTYNSLDTQNGTAGRGWSASAELEAPFSFRKLIDHSGDAEYPQNVVELVDTMGYSHFYHDGGSGTYAPFVGDFAWLKRNSDNTWTLTLADGGRFKFNLAGDPVEYRTVPQSLDQPSFSYVYTSGKLSSITDPVGRSATLTYDANSRLWKVTSNQSNPARTWTTTYTSGGELQDVQDPVNTAKTLFTYDATSKKMISATTPAGIKVEFGYDGSGRVNEVRQIRSGGASPYVTKIEYTNSTTTKVIRPKGNISPCSGDSTCRAKYTTTYGMDSTFRLTSVQITTPSGSTATKSIAWNTQNLMTSETDFAGHQTVNTYDVIGNLLTERDPLNNTVTHNYDENYTGLQGVYFNNETLTPPAVLRRLDPQVSFAWSGSPGTGVNADSFSVRWTGYLNVPTTGSYTFYTTADHASRLSIDGLQIIDDWADNADFSEKSSSPQWLTAGLHSIVAEHYDKTGSASMTLKWAGPSITKQTIPQANLKPGFNLETSTIDELGNTTTYIHEDEATPDYYNDQDAFIGLLIEEKDTNTPAVGSTQTLRTKNTYNSYGQLTSETLPKGNTGGSPDPAYTTTYVYYGASESATNSCTGTSYNQTGLLKSISQSGLATVTQVHDGAGNVVSQAEGRGTTCNAYNASGRLTSMKAPDRASATTYAYDPDGRLKTVTDPTLPAPTNYTYDDLGRLATAKDAMAATGETAVTYTRDEHGNAIQRTDKTGTTLYGIDSRDQTISLTDPANRTYSFAYDVDGQLTSQTLPNNTKATLVYDNAGQVTSYLNRTTSGTPLADYTYAYDARGNRLTENGPQGPWVYRYDSTSRLEQVHDPVSGRTRRYVFDLNANRSEVKLNQGWSHATSANTWGSDPLVNKSVTDNWQGNDASFSYPLKFSFPFRGTNYTSAYVSTNGMISLGTSAGGANTIDLPTTTLRAIAPLARDLKVDPSSLTNPGRGIYVEEPLDNSFVRIRWKAETQDAALNPTNFEVILYPSGQVKFNYQTLPSTGTSRVGVTYGNGLDFVTVPNYDKTVVPSNAQTVTFTAQAESTQTSYTYNALDQITAGTGLSGIAYSTDGEQTAITGPSPRGSWTYTYDGRGLMKQATSGSTTIDWTLDGESRIVKKVKGSSDTRYRFAAPGDASAWEEDASGAVTQSYITGPGGLLASYASSTPTFYFMNGHGDVVQTRDLSGNLVASFAYDENGKSTSGSPSPYGYTGNFQRERDVDTALIRMGMRMYDPLTSRFTSRDPVAGGDRNFYLYASSNPINTVDLDGRGFCVFGRRKGGGCRGGGSRWRNPHNCRGGITRRFRSAGRRVAAIAGSGVRAIGRVGRFIGYQVFAFVRDFVGVLEEAGLTVYLLWGAIAAVCVLTAGTACTVAMYLVINQYNATLILAGAYASYHAYRRAREQIYGY